MDQPVTTSSREEDEMDALEKEEALFDTANTRDCHQIQVLKGLAFDAEHLQQRIYSIDYSRISLQTMNGYVDTLIYTGANMHDKGIFDCTPLHFAAQSGSYICLKLLHEGGANCHIPFDVPMYETVAPYIRGRLAFQVVVVCNNVECLEKLIRFSAECGANMDVKDKYGYTPLHYAAKIGNYQCLKMLLEAGANCCIPAVYETAAPYIRGTTALHLASLWNRVECVKVLIQFGADCGANVDVKDEYGCTPLHYAVSKGNYVCLKVLLDAGANCCIPVDVPVHGTATRYIKGTTALHLAAKCNRNHVECVRELIKFGASCEASMDVKDEYGCTPLHYAASKGNYVCLKVLLEAGANSCIPVDVPLCATATRYIRGTTALHLATQFDRVECVEELIKFGADCGAVNENGHTSLSIAAQAGFSKCVLTHLKYAHGSAFFSLPSYNTFDTPLHFAVKNRMSECIKELLHLGSDVNYINIDGLSPLHLLCSTYRNGSKIDMEILKLLVLEGYDTDINKQTENGLTALYFSFYADCIPMTAFLITYGADVNLKKEGTDLSFLEYELIVNTNFDTIKYFIKCMPQLPRLKSLDVTFPTIALHKEYFCDESAIWHDVVLPDKVKFWLNRTETQVYVEMYNYEVRPVPCDIDMLRFRYVPYHIRYPLQQPLLNLIYEHVIDELKYMDENPNKERRDTLSHFSEHQLLMLKKQLWYEQIASTPHSLQHYCRFSIRKCMGPSNLKHIRKLPLPSKLLSYLMFECDK